MKYISFSRMVLFEKSPEEYARVYILGGKSYTNASMEYGSKVATALERKEETGIKSTDEMLRELPKLEMADEYTEATINTIPVLARMDAADRDYRRFYEYKTGIQPWTQNRVDKADQLTFYAMVCWAITGKVPEDIRLYWIETKRGEDGIECTGKIREFKTKREMIDVVKMISRVTKAWIGIKELELDILT